MSYLLTQDQIEQTSLTQVMRMTVEERREYYRRRHEFLNPDEAKSRLESSDAK